LPCSFSQACVRYTVSRLREAFDGYSQTIDKPATEVAEAG